MRTNKRDGVKKLYNNMIYLIRYTQNVNSSGFFKIRLPEYYTDNNEMEKSNHL